MEMILSWVVGIAILVIMAFIIIGNAVRFIMWIKCFKIKECYNRRCINNAACAKYSEQLTEDEYNELQSMIEEYRKQYK